MSKTSMQNLTTKIIKEEYKKVLDSIRVKKIRNMLLLVVIRKHECKCVILCGLLIKYMIKYLNNKLVE